MKGGRFFSCKSKECRSAGALFAKATTSAPFCDHVLSLQNCSKKKDKDYTVFTDETLFDAQDISKEFKDRDDKSMHPGRQIKSPVLTKFKI